MRPQYETNLSRSGYAIAVGGMLTGLLVAALVANGGQQSPTALFVAWLVGTFFAMIGITGAAGPIWLALHLLGARGPVAAALTGIGVALFVFIGGQTYGFGMLTAPVSDSQTLIYRWASAIATSLVLSGIAAIIALAMWRVAYRRVG